MRRLFLAGVLCLFQFLCLSLAFGQGGRGTINGTVADPSGALVASAQVQVKNTQTGQVTTLKTTSDGNYSAPFLETGIYQISASHEGFETQTQTKITLTTDQVLSVNFTLKVGSQNTKVEVEASATQIDTTTGAIGETIGEKSVAELPLNGRNPASLVATVPGAVDTFTSSIPIPTPGPGSGSPEETGASVNGSRIGGVVYMLDGIVHMNNYFNTADPFPNPDATQEFRVITNNFDAQYGYTAGAIVSIATRSGTNQWHGTAFDFLRNNALNSKEYFTHVANNLKRNQFGGSLGGPVIKDKLFAFGNLQLTRQRSDVSTSGTLVPTTAMVTNGDFSSICNTGFTAGICNDRVNGQIADQLYQTWQDTHADTGAGAYPGNQVPTSSFSPFALNLLQGIPVNASGVVNVLGIANNPDITEYTLRADYNINTTQTLSVRYFYNNYSRPGSSGKGNYLEGSGSSRSELAKVLNAEVSHVWTIRPNLVNDLRIGFGQNNSAALTGIRAVGGGPLTFQSLGSNLNEISDFIGSVSVHQGYFGVSGIPVVQSRHNWDLVDTVSMTTGRHTITTGFQFFSQYGLEQATWEGDPLVDFGGQVTGFAPADFLLGFPSEVQASGGEYNRYTANNFAAFGQDSIKLKPNLNINLGVRWEPQNAPVSVGLHTADFVPGQQSTRFPNAPKGLVYPGDTGIPDGGWNTRYDVFLPRISVAWSPKMLPNTSVRSAFALMDIPYDYSFYNHQSANAPFSPAYNMVYNGPGITASPACPTGVLNITDPFGCYAPTNFVDPFPPFAGPNDHPPSTVAFATPTSLQAVFNPHTFKPAKQESWNLSIQHTFGSDFLVSAAYIGSHDYDLYVPLELSPGAFPSNTPLLLSQGFQTILDYDSIGVASYNAIQFAVEKRFSHGLQFSSNFTYSKNLDMSSIASISNTGSVYNPYNPRATYGISDLNIPKILNTTIVYQVPRFSNLGTVASKVVGGWEVSAIWTAHSGSGITIDGGQSGAPGSCGDSNASCASAGGGRDGDHADLVAGQSLGVHKGSKSQWLTQYYNVQAFTFNAPGTFGDSGRNIIQGPGWNNWDLNLAKNFAFRERYNVEFRWEMFNAFNRTEFQNPGNNDYSNAGGTNFGQITGTQCNGQDSCVGGPRLMQAALKFTF
jgi:hypothetical protein